MGPRSAKGRVARLSVIRMAHAPASAPATPARLRGPSAVAAPGRCLAPGRRRSTRDRRRAGKFVSLLGAGVVHLPGAGPELVFEVGGGDGDAALHLGRRGVEVLGQVEGAIEQQILAVGDGGGEGLAAQVGGQNWLERIAVRPAPPGWRAAPRRARSRRREPRLRIRPGSGRA